MNVIAILDAGKTNKKVFLFDEQYKIVYEHSVRLDETVDEDGDACEDVEALRSWARHALDPFLGSGPYNIRAINFSSYGASFVHINALGTIQFPLYNYLKPYSPELLAKFFADYGPEKKVSRETASPVLGHLNSGLLLYRLQQQNRFLEKDGVSLHLPQYLSFLYSGRMYSDITSIGCHTMMWDFNNSSYHRWVTEEGIVERLAPVFPSDAVVHVDEDSRKLAIGVGLHDSSSALIPYLMCYQEPFILISTGTWSISLNPFNTMPLTDDELEKDCLSFLSYTGKPVKASRLFAGHEHELQTRRLATHFHQPANFFEEVYFDHAIVEKLENTVHQDGRRQFEPGSSLFATRGLDEFSGYHEAYHQLVMDIVAQQVLSTSLIIPSEGVKRIFVDGGFSKNVVYMNLLARAYPGIEMYAASVAQASAIGAALAIHKHWNEHPVPQDLIELKRF